MKLLLSLLLAPVLSLAAATGSVTLLDGTPIAGAVIKSLADSVTTSASGTFALGRTSGISSRYAKTVPVTSHLTVENGRPRLSFAGMDIAGRTLNGVRYERTPGVAQAQSLNGAIGTRSTFSARSTGTPDTLKVYWKGKRLTVLPVTTDTTVTFRIDTAWKDDAGIPWNPSITYGSLFDSRDKQTYRTVTIGTQTWMAENLNYTVDSSWWFNNQTKLGAKYGRLYKWNSAMILPDSCNKKTCANQISGRWKGVCSEGWHIPTDLEWGTLLTAVGGDSVAGTELKSTTGWYKNTLMGWNDGLDEFGFRVIGAGRRYDTEFVDLEYRTYFWSTSEATRDNAWYRVFFYRDSSAGRYGHPKSEPISLRCLKD